MVTLGELRAMSRMALRGGGRFHCRRVAWLGGIVTGSGVRLRRRRR